jgi:two-component system, LytTR family, response regulator AlgR
VSDNLNVYLVDDEGPAIKRLKRLLDEVDGCRVIGSSSSGASALSDCARLQPEVIFLDVEMPGLDGVEVARRLGRMKQPPALIFVTAFERYAVDAFDLAAVDYLVKPVRRERLLQALERARKQRVLPGRTPVLTARLADRTMTIPLDDVRVLQAEDKYTSVYYVGGLALIEDSLISLEERFPEWLLRVHRNALVARRHLRSLFRDEAGNERVEIDDVECRPEVSRRNLPSVRRELRS